VATGAVAQVRPAGAICCCQADLKLPALLSGCRLEALLVDDLGYVHKAGRDSVFPLWRSVRAAACC